MSGPTDATDDDGRSRRFWALVGVAGLGLQVALVVVVGAFVLSYTLGLGTTLPASPTADFESDAVNGSYVLTHDGGDSLDATNVIVRRNGEAVGTWAELSLLSDADGEVSAGDRLTLPNATEGDTITVLWNGQDHTAVVFEDDVGPLRTPAPTPKTTESSQRSSSTTGTPGTQTAPTATSSG